MIPNLNWKEWQQVAESIAPQVTGLFVDRVIVPERPEFPDGYIKGEWTLRLTGRGDDRALTLSVRAREAYLFLDRAKGRRAAETATRSAFDLSLNKTLKGSKLLTIEAVERERTLILWFSTPSDHERLGFVLTLIPAQPEAYLITSPSMAILAHTKRAEVPKGEIYLRPDGSRAPTAPPVHEDWVRDAETFRQVIESSLASEAFRLRLNRFDRIVAERKKVQVKRLKESHTSLAKLERDPNYAHWADCLKAVIHSPPPLKDGIRKVMDYSLNEIIEVPCDEKLDLKQQVEKFYQQSKRSSRTREECESRAKLAQECLDQLTPLEARRQKLSDQSPDFPTLAKLEQAIGLASGIPMASNKNTPSGLGRHFLSKDGYTIWVGRSRDENLELTFKFARGNDVWLHVKGRPGSHVVIPIPPKKSAPLDTLLDAATLAVYYSGGQSWGKTEVDYTFRKYVKRIKQSTEVSYTNNKTLIVEPSGERLQRLLSQEKAPT